MENPFNPSFGKMPSVFLKRGSLTNRIITELNRENTPFQTSLIYGQRGSGKTTLMTEVAKKLSSNPKWIIVNLVLDEDLLTSLINQLNNSLISLNLIKDFDLKLSFMGIGVEASVNKQIIENFQIVFQNILAKLTKKGYKVLICIDEVHLDPLLEKLASIYQIMISKNYNVSLLMAGLPENISEIQNDNVLTFLLRANRIVLNPLDVESIKQSYSHIFTQAGYKIDFETILYMTKQTLGFAYAFQLLGYHVWNKAEQQANHEITTKPIDHVLDIYLSDLNRNVYFKVYSEMSQKEKEFVQAMVKAKTSKVKSQTIGKIMNKNSNYITVYRRKLIDDQVIRPNGYGYVSFLLPYFDKFVEQQMILEDF
ncbi:ATP-binding protein [Lactobacillus crispatus]|uniref:ATP-binding protein n=1 Tax=Lactobacillus crispatus TaxID=47770 RepID=UPI0018AC7E55|nr:ATP-binding protein [Lactobacillus crispatus]